MNILFKENYLGPQGVQNWLWAVPGSTWGLVGVYSESTWGLLGVFLEESHFFEKVSLAAARARFLGPGPPPESPGSPAE